MLGLETKPRQPSRAEIIKANPVGIVRGDADLSTTDPEDLERYLRLLQSRVE